MLDNKKEFNYYDILFVCLNKLKGVCSDKSNKNMMQKLKKQVINNKRNKNTIPKLNLMFQV